LEAERQARALKQQKYKEAIEKADQLFTSKTYTDSKAFYQQALSIDQTATYPGERIREIDRIIAKLQADALAAKALADKKLADEEKISAGEKLYLEKRKIADDNFNRAQWPVARFYYIELLKIRQGDNYSLERIDACDKMIDSGITAEKMQEYKNKIVSADGEMKAKSYSSARFYYRSASEILKWETYPLQQLNEIDKLLAEKLGQSEQRLFTENKNKGDEAFIKKEYPAARFYYNKAIEIIQSDYVKSRINEIESILNGSESKNINAAYDDYVKKGNESMNQKNSSIARFYFQKAGALKPEENYPKEMLRKIDSEVVKP
jgi:hypothetical protein